MVTEAMRAANPNEDGYFHLQEQGKVTSNLTATSKPNDFDQPALHFIKHKLLTMFSVADTEKEKGSKHMGINLFHKQCTFGDGFLTSCTHFLFSYVI